MSVSEVNKLADSVVTLLDPVECPWMLVLLLPDGSGRVIDNNLARWQEFSTSSKPARDDLNQLLDVTIGQMGAPKP
jgi:hypothetical protein